MAGRGSKPGERRGGRQKGTPNKFTASVKTTIVEALNAGDGAVAFFTRLKADDPKTFATLCGRFIPHEVTGPDEQPLFELPDDLEIARRGLFAMTTLIEKVRNAGGEDETLPPLALNAPSS